MTTTKTTKTTPKREEHATLADALVAFQRELPRVAKDALNPAFKSKYATYDALASLVVPLLAAQGVKWGATATMTDEGFVLRYAIVHAPTGEEDGGVWPLPDPRAVAPQEVRKATTYAKRTALELLTGVPTADDPDDDDANDVPPAHRYQRQPAKPSVPQLTEGEWLNRINAAPTLDDAVNVWRVAAEACREGQLGQETVDKLAVVCRERRAAEEQRQAELDREAELEAEAEADLVAELADEVAQK